MQVQPRRTTLKGQKHARQRRQPVANGLTTATSAAGRKSSNASLSTVLGSPLSCSDARPLGFACPSNPFVRVPERFGVKPVPSGGAPRPPLDGVAPARGDSMDCIASIQPRVSRSLSVATRTYDTGRSGLPRRVQRPDSGHHRHRWVLTESRSGTSMSTVSGKSRSPLLFP